MIKFVIGVVIAGLIVFVLTFGLGTIFLILTSKDTDDKE
jgi:hypothetical protein